MANTKCIGELEQIQNEVLEKWNCHLESGIKDGVINLEDGLPWLVIVGEFTKEKACLFAQELANELDLTVLFNRLEVFAEGPSTLHLILDITSDLIEDDTVVPAYIQNEDDKEFFDSYGKGFNPSSENVE